MARNNPFDFVAGQPGFIRSRSLVIMSHEFINSKGTLLTYEKSRVVRLHELAHSIVAPALAATAAGKRAQELERIKAEAIDEANQAFSEMTNAINHGADSTEVAKRRKLMLEKALASDGKTNAQNQADVTFLISAFDEMFADLIPVMILGDPSVFIEPLANDDGGLNIRDMSQGVKLEDMPDTPPPGIFKTEFKVTEDGLYSQTEYRQAWLTQLGYDPHTHYESVKKFVYDKILTSLRYQTDPRGSLRLLKRVFLHELDLRFNNVNLGYFALSPQDANHRVIESLKK